MALKINCAWCNAEYDYEETRDAFDDRYADDGFVYEYNVENSIGDLCLNCAIHFAENDLKNDDDDDFPPPGCRECGGDYPRCASSCSRIDD